MAKHPDIVDDQLHTPAYVQSSDPGALGPGMMWIDTTIAGTFVSKARNLGDSAWEEVGGVPPDISPIPHISPGVGNLNVLLHSGLSVYITGAYGSVVKISAFDLIKMIIGGEASPSFTYFIRKDPGSYGAGNSDPTAEYITYDGDEVGFNQVGVKISDGVTTTGEMFPLIFVDGATGP